MFTFMFCNMAHHVSLLLASPHNACFFDNITQWTRDWFIMHLKEAPETSFVEITTAICDLLQAFGCGRNGRETETVRHDRKGNFNWYQHSNAKAIKFKFMSAFDDEFYAKLKSSRLCRSFKLVSANINLISRLKFICAGCWIIRQPLECEVGAKKSNVNVVFMHCCGVHDMNNQKSWLYG